MIAFPQVDGFLHDVEHSVFAVCSAVCFIATILVSALKEIRGKVETIVGLVRNIICIFKKSKRRRSRKSRALRGLKPSPVAGLLNRVASFWRGGIL
jgi:hypothetical protein